jgi:hypothetical protein
MPINECFWLMIGGGLVGRDRCMVCFLATIGRLVSSGCITSLQRNDG